MRAVVVTAGLACVTACSAEGGDAYAGAFDSAPGDSPSSDEPGDDDSEPAEPGDDVPRADDGRDAGPTDVVEPSCAVVGCPDAQPFCGESGACFECESQHDCELATCDAGSCESLPVEGLVTWLRADALPVGPVGNWPSAFGMPATQDDVARLPTVVPDAIAGGPAVVFDGVDDQLVVGDGGLIASASERTVVAVVQAAAPAGHIVGATTDGTGYGLALEDGRPRWSAGAAVGGWPHQRLLEVPRVVTLRSSGGGSSMHVDGVLVDAVSGVADPATALRTTLGAADGDATGAASNPFAGAIAHVLVYDRALDEAERRQVEGWLSQSMGLSAVDPVDSLTADARIYYPMNETGEGVRADALGNLPLSPFPSTDGIEAVPGMVGEAQHINGAYGGYHFFRSGAGEALDHSADSFTWAGWVAIDPLEPYQVTQTLVGKWDPPSTCQMRVWYEPLSQQWSLSVSPTGNEADAVTVTHPDAVPDGAWALVEAWRDAARGEVGIRVSSVEALGDAVTLPLEGVLPVTSNDLNVAAHATCGDGFLQGSIDALGQWHRALTDAESALLHAGFEMDAAAP